MSDSLVGSPPGGKRVALDTSIALGGSAPE